MKRQTRAREPIEDLIDEHLRTRRANRRMKKHATDSANDPPTPDAGKIEFRTILRVCTCKRRVQSVNERYLKSNVSDPE
jgi:hypothetical protein